MTLSEAGIQLQQMTKADLKFVESTSKAIHTHLPERPEVFQEKFQLFPAGCRTLRLGESTVGYGIAYPWLLNSIPPLDTFFISLPRSPKCLFIHDLVVLPKARSHGAAAAFVTEMRTLAMQAGLASLALVSVYDTNPLWTRLGFRVLEDASLSPKLIAYGNTAKYMVSHGNA